MNEERPDSEASPPAGPFRISRRPLVLPALAMVAGCAVGGSVPLHGLIPLVLAVVVVIALLARSWGPMGSSLGLAVVFFLAGMAWSSLHAFPRSERWIGHVTSRAAERVGVEGWIRSDPTEDLLDRGDRLARFEFNVIAVNRTGAWEPAEGVIDVTIYGVEANAFRYGDRLRFNGVLQELDRDRPTHRYPLRLRTQADEVETTGRAGHPVIGWSYSARRWCLQQLSRHISDSPDAVSLTQALLLGYREGIPDRTREAFARTGSLHILAISGLHVGILSGLLIGFLQLCGISRHRWVWTLAPVLVIYSLATGGSVSAVRASIMIICYFLAPALNRRPDPLSAMALAALLVLAIYPLDVFNPGFHLSFVVVTGLLIMTSRLLAAWERAGAVDPWALGDEASWLSNLRSFRSTVLSLSAVALAAWLASFPLISATFNLVSPIALPANLVIVPLAFLILTAGCLSLTLGAVIPGLGGILNHAHLGFSGAMLSFIDGIEQIPGGHWFVAPPPTWLMAAWYIALGVAFLSSSRRMMVVGWIGVVVTGVFLGGLTLGTRPPSVSTKEFSGFPTYLIRSGNDVVVVDPGPDFRNETLVRWLRGQGVNRISAVVLTRALTRPSSGVLPLIERIPVREVWASPPTPRSRGYADLLAALDVPVRQLTAPDRGVLDQGMEWEVLHPPQLDRYNQARDAALVIRFAHQHHSWGVYGFASADVLNTIAAQPRNPATEIMLVLHMEDPATWPDDWLERARPRAVVFHDRQVLQTHRNPDGYRRSLEERGIDWINPELDPIRLGR